MPKPTRTWWATDPRLRGYMDSVREGLVFFVRPHRELLRLDRVREDTGWDEVVRIDGMVKLMLEMFAVPDAPMACLSMRERVRLVERVLALAGLAPRGRVAPLAHEARERPARDGNGHASGSRRAGAPG